MTEGEKCVCRRKQSVLSKSGMRDCTYFIHRFRKPTDFVSHPVLLYDLSCWYYYNMVGRSSCVCVLIEVE